MDWNEVWNNSIRMTSRDRLNTGSFWDENITGRIPTYFPENLTEDQLKIIQPKGDERILEIGPGAGRLTVPLARSCSKVTVIDPSAGMLVRLAEELRSKGLCNVRIEKNLWERIDLERLGVHHKLVSSFSLFMYDVKEQMRRMNRASDTVYLFVPADIRIPFDIQKILFGEVAVRHTDHEILSKIAKDLGFGPRNFIIQYPSSYRFPSLDAAMEHYIALFNIPLSLREQVIEHLSSSMKVDDAGYYTSVPRRVGVICW